MAFHPEDRVVASCSEDNSIKLWNLDDGGLISTMKAHSDWVQAVAWSPCGQWLASGGDDKMVYVYDAKTFEVKWPLSCDSPVYSIDWHDNRLVAGCGDGTIQVFDAQSGDRLSTVKAHSDFVGAVAWSPCGQWLASGGDDNMVYVYDAKTFEVKWPLRGENAIFSLAFSPDGQLIATGEGNPSNASAAGAVRIYCASTGQVKRALRGHRYAPSLSKECFLSLC